MKSMRKKIFIWTQIGTFIAIWITVLLVSGSGFIIEWEALKKLPTVVTVYVFSILIFTRWAWRLPIFRGWLVTLPDLQGTWKGTLESTWVDPDTEQKVSPKDVTLVIRQTFYTVNCVMYTDESESSSMTAQISEDDESGIFQLSFNYTNRPRVNLRDRSQIHDGATILKLTTQPNKKLAGEYWTNRKTTGDITVKFVSKKLDQTL